MILKRFLFNIKRDASIVGFKNVQKIEKNAFAYDNTVEYLNYDEKLQVVEQSACEECKNLQIIKIGKNEYIKVNEVLESPEDRKDRNVFIGKEEEIPNTDTLTIQTKAFYNCSKLHTVIFPDNKNITIEKDAFTGCTALRTVVLGLGVVNIHDQSFIGCTNVNFVCLSGSTADQFAREHGINIINV